MIGEPSERAEVRAHRDRRHDAADPGNAENASSTAGSVLEMEVPLPSRTNALTGADESEANALARLRASLDTLVRLIERVAGHGMRGSVLLLDADGVTLRHGAAPNLPEAYCRLIDGERIGPAAGSCGTAAYRREQVIVREIATDPLWASYKRAAEPFGLAACWSTPIFAADKSVLGTFAMYYDEPRAPTAADIGLTEVAAFPYRPPRKAATLLRKGCDRRLVSYGSISGPRRHAPHRRGGGAPWKPRCLSHCGRSGVVSGKRIAADGDGLRAARTRRCARQPDRQLRRRRADPDGAIRQPRGRRSENGCCLGTQRIALRAFRSEHRSAARRDDDRAHVFRIAQ